MGKRGGRNVCSALRLTSALLTYASFGDVVEVAAAVVEDEDNEAAGEAAVATHDKTIMKFQRPMRSLKSITTRWTSLEKMSARSSGKHCAESFLTASALLVRKGTRQNPRSLLHKY